MQTDQAQDGFTIIETLIALVILSVALLISAQTISIATRSEITAAERRGVIAAHQALLSREYQDFDCTDHGKQGSFDHYAWSMKSTIVTAIKDGSRAGCSILMEIRTAQRAHSFFHFRSEVTK